jgi:hypothetical protein
MRKIMKLLTTVGAVVVSVGAAGVPGAVGPERIVVPLADPAKPATIHVSLVNGGITVEGYDGKDVVVEARSRDTAKDDDDDDRDDDRDDAIRDGVEGAEAAEPAPPRAGGRSSAGMRRIPNRSLGLSVDANGNQVRVDAESWRHAIDIRLLVPASSILKLDCVNDGNITVTGVAGGLELSNVNGSITVKDAMSQVVADTTNGPIVVNFVRWGGDKPMAFSTLNGDVDVTFPGSLKANLVMRSDNGEIYSDFEVALDPSEAKVRERRAEGRYRIEVEQAVRGTVGGGGPEIVLKTFNGDIFLRKGR